MKKSQSFWKKLGLNTWKIIVKIVTNLWYLIIRFVTIFIRPFFFSEGKFCPPYFWITIFLIFIVRILLLRLDPKTMLILKIDDSLILGLLGFVFSWLGVYSWYRSVKNKNNNGG